MGILSWLVVGLIAGFIGSKIVNRSGEGLVRDIILGVIGAVIGDAIFTELGLVGVTGVNLTSIVVAAIGAIIVLVVYHAVIGRRALHEILERLFPTSGGVFNFRLTQRVPR
jgi:uncharacterized membrane protein YeaQ/YmgE (transglycosylase-associated protein family)